MNTRWTIYLEEAGPDLVWVAECKDPDLCVQGGDLPQLRERVQLTLAANRVLEEERRRA